MSGRVSGAVDRPLFGSTLTIMLVVTFIGAVMPEKFGSALSALQGWISNNFGWFFLLTVAAFIAFLAWVALGRYGHVKLGKDDETPEFSTFSWIAMLFSCGIGVGFIFWGVAEPLYHYMQTPYLAEPGTPAAVPVAMQISLLHWGIHGWVVYAVVGLAMAYAAFRLDRPLTVANALYGVLGERTQGPWGKLVDFLAAFATIAGIATSLGMGLISVRFGVEHLFGISLGTGGLVVIMFLLIAAYTASAVSGLERGIRYLSNVNVWLAFGVLVFFLLAGPTRFVLNLMTESVGEYFRNFVFMTFWTDTVGQSGWLGWWTVFYWSWWIAWGPFVGGFVARISRGRTVREFVGGVVLVPFLVTIVWFSVVGGSALNTEIAGSVKLWDAIQADVGSGIYTLLEAFPLGHVVSFVVFFNLLTFLVTSADSGAFFVGMIMSGGDLQPRTWMKLTWGFLMGGVAVILLLAGGLKGVQTASIVAALPFAFVTIGIMLSMVRMLSGRPVPVREPVPIRQLSGEAA